MGAIAGGIFVFGGSALSQIFSGEDFSFKKALGAGANGAIVGGVHGALIGSEVGIGVSLAADFGAGALGCTAEQLIGTGRASAKESIKSGLINAVTGRIYGTGELKSAKSAFLRGFAAGGATSGINYLSDALTPRAGRLGRSSVSRFTGTMLMGAASAIGRDPRRGCETGVRDNEWMGLRTAYGYQYGGTQAGQEKSEYSFGGFIKETLIGAVTGGLASTAFYGANKVVQALVGSIRSNKTSYGKSSENLDWDAVVSRRGETRKAHVALHEANDLSKPSHGVFYGDSISTINKVWDNRGNGYMISEGNTDLYIVPYQNAGYAGGYGGQGNNLNYVTIITQKGTNNIITGFPGNGYKYTEAGLIGGN